MSQSNKPQPFVDGANNSRRDFLRRSTVATLSAGLASGLVVPKNVHAAGADEILRIGLVGCGGRGTGAAINALKADPLTKLVAVADAFRDRADHCLKELKHNKEIRSRVTVDEDHFFSGFNAYKQLIDSGVDVVILTTSPHFRSQHLAYAVENNKHCFVEKPIATDAPRVREVLRTCKKAKARGLSIVSGLCWRYDVGVRETIDRIQNGAIGDIIAIESVYNADTQWHRGDKPGWSRMEYQMRNWPYYTWLSGDHICEQAIHSLDKCTWLLGDVAPLVANGTGGRQQRTETKYGHIFDHHSVTFDFPDNKKVFFTCRQQANCPTPVDEIVLGTGGQAKVLAHKINGKKKWEFEGKKPSMYDHEHVEFFQSIRNGNPINNGEYMCRSTMMAIMGRMATYTGQTITWDDCWNDKTRLGPEAYVWGDMPEPEVAIPGSDEGEF